MTREEADQYRQHCMEIGERWGKRLAAPFRRWRLNRRRRNVERLAHRYSETILVGREMSEDTFALIERTVYGNNEVYHGH